MLSGFCEIAERPGVLGCRGCAPKFVAADAPPDAFAEVTSLIEGPFTGPGRVEVLVGFSPCGPESERAATRLLRHDGAGFRSVEGFSGLDDARCRASRNAGGYARLACVAQDYLASEPVGADGIEIWLDVFDLHRRQVQRVVSVFDTLRSACEDGRLSELRAFGIGDFDFKDLDGDGDDDLWLMALSMMTAEPVRYDAECRQYLEPGEPTVGTSNPLECELDKYRCDALAFLLEGGEWRPSAETQVLLAELRARKSTTSALP